MPTNRRAMGRTALLALFLLLALVAGYRSLVLPGRTPSARDGGEALRRPGHSRQAVGAEETVGVPTTLGRGIVETLLEIMGREAETKSAGPFRYRERRETPPRSPDLLENPAAPVVPQWPPLPEGTSAELNSLTGGWGIAPLSPQTVGTSFKGVAANESGFIPPDSMGDIGPSQILFVENGRVKVFDRNGGLGALNVTDTNFFSSVLDTAGGEEVTDPQVRYDRLSGRWFVTMLSLPATLIPNKVLIAVSSGPTITGTSSFTFFAFQHDLIGPTPNADTGQFADYDSLGVDRFALYIGVNMFNQAGTFYLGATGFVVNKADLLAGTLTVTAFRQIAPSAGAGLYSPRGVSNDDPAATEGYFIGGDNDAFSLLQIRRVSNPGGIPSISGNLSLVVPTTAFPIGQVVMGSAANRRLDALDDRLYSATIHKNKITGASTLWTSHNISVNATCTGSNMNRRNGSRWYEIQNLTTTPTLRQAGTLCDPSAAATARGFWMDTVAANGQGHMALGASYASVNDFAGVAVAGRLRADTLGTTQAATLAVVSGTSYNVQDVDFQRWGDYSHTVVDPNDDQTFWTFQEYCDATDSWGVRVIQLVAPPPAAPSGAAPAAICQGLSSVDVTITGTSSSGSEFFDPGPDTGGPGYLNHIAGSITGGVTVSSVSFTDPTHVTLHLSTLGAGTGAQDVTITNPDGQAAAGTGLLTITTGPSTPAASNDGPICAGQTLHLSASTVAGATYSWTGPNGFASSAQNPSIPGATAAASGTYHVTVTVGGCTSSPAATAATVSGNGGACNDGNPCTMGDACSAGACVPGGPKDADGDAHIDASCGGNDCNDADVSAWGAPVEVTNLQVLTESPAGLSWNSQAALVGPGTPYDLVSGNLLMPDAGVAFSPASCLQGSTATVYSDVRPGPGVEAGFWYLVRARNSCGNGTYGSALRDAGIPPCP